MTDAAQMQNEIERLERELETLRFRGLFDRRAQQKTLKKLKKLRRQFAESEGTATRLEPVRRAEPKRPPKAPKKKPARPKPKLEKPALAKKPPMAKKKAATKPAKKTTGAARKKTTKPAPKVVKKPARKTAGKTKKKSR